MQTLVDVVNVESGDLQWSSLTRKDHSVLTRVSHCKYFVCVGRVLEDEVGIAVECSLTEPQPAHRLMGSVPQTAHRSLAEVLAMRQLPGLLGLALCGSGLSVAALATAGFDEIGKAIAACFEHAE
jgi:hypothetical protein